MVRKIVQTATAVLFNANFTGFATGTIYRGSLKNVCVPGLNCYSCPGALGACPIGSFQSAVGAVQLQISMYVTGFLIFIGALFGRLICGWVCPFGLIQELLYKIKSRKIKKVRAFSWMKYLKYAVLVGFVIVWPLVTYLQTGAAVPTFCKYICPAGTLEAGIPLVAANTSLQSAIGLLFSWKLWLLAATLVWAVFIYRPFCRFVCPLGAIYALFNRVAVFGLRFDSTKCGHCGACAEVCKMEVDPAENTGSAECIRCGDCVKICKAGALKFGVKVPKTSREFSEI